MVDGKKDILKRNKRKVLFSVEVSLKIWHFKKVS